MPKKPPKASADDPLGIALESLAPTGQGWRHLREVRSNVGYDGSERYADGVAVQCWPSRGLGCVGLELKVQRRDWLRELKQPEKSAPIQKYCKAWWVVTTPEVIRAGELPPTWGHIEISGKTATIMVQAPTLEPEAPGWTFLASLLRHRADAEAKLIRETRWAAMEEARREFNGEEVEKLRSALSDLTLERDRYKRSEQHACAERDRLREAIRNFDAITGVSFYCLSGPDNVPACAKTVRLAQALIDGDLNRLSGVFGQITELLAEARELLDR